MHGIYVAGFRMNGVDHTLPTSFSVDLTFTGKDLTRLLW